MDKGIVATYMLSGAVSSRRRVEVQSPFQVGARVSNPNPELRTTSRTTGDTVMAAQDIPQAINLIAEEIRDRRTSNRVTYDTTLGFADFDGCNMPSVDKFHFVQGSDLSHTGISFTTRKWPATDQIVLMLGDRVKPIYASARIVGCLCRHQNGHQAGFEVRCEFERWL